ncbi:AcrR family transcriptional regulator [Mycobacterium frederiksbergense]|uniref:AcrR family transcriptional regulator n=1 Tax=Mycolicibacterium frederiksbergense TaxID=117567 RepID=A0ABT6L1D5_9MYCO|nr:TetR/AcrR family transcriptional regulator [Mycolicibacterium frederiksbergense]MDH6196022.1 AcrR family transcriptional regulator [Mycolicibacterium frederiksbergense]
MPRPSVEAERRPQILTAACEVIAALGVPDLRLSDVAKSAGVSSGTVHYYFDTKKDLINAAFEFNLTESLNRRQELLSSSKNNLAILNDLVESYLPKDEQSQRAWKVWLALWTEATRDPLLQAVNEKLYGQWREVVADVIRAAQKDGTARAGNPVTLANMLIGMLDGLAVQILLGSEAVTLASVRKTIKAFIADVIAQ